MFFNENFDQKAPFGKSSASSDEFGLSKSIDSHEVDNFETFREFSTFQLGFVIGKFITNSDVIKNLKNGDFSIRLSYIEGSIRYGLENFVKFYEVLEILRIFLQN